MRSPRVAPAPALAGGLVTAGSLIAWQQVRDAAAIPTGFVVLVATAVAVAVGVLTWVRLLPLRPYMALVTAAFTGSAVVLAWYSGAQGSAIVPAWLAVATAVLVVLGWPSYPTFKDRFGAEERRSGRAIPDDFRVIDPDDVPDDVTVRDLAMLLVAAQHRAERAEARLDAIEGGADPHDRARDDDADGDWYGSDRRDDDGDDYRDLEGSDDADSTRAASRYGAAGVELVGGRWAPADDLTPLGAGRCGEVIVVRDALAVPGAPDVAAMKLLSAGDVSESMQRRLLREVDLLRRIDSDWVTPLLDGGWDEETGQAFLVLPLHAEGSLAQLLAEYSPTPLPVGVALRYGFDCFAALADLHECAPPIVHRDVKPANLLLTDDRVDVVLCDFGIARLIEMQTQGITVGMPPHTPMYAAPEQLDGVVEPCVDVYAGAAVCYEMLTGRPPFAREIEDARGSRTWLDMVDDPRTRPVPLAARRPDVPTEVTDVLHACLSLDPHVRPTAAHVSDVLAPYADDDALGSVPRVARTLYDE